MKISLSRGEMLSRRRLAGGFEPLRTDATVEDTAGTDIDAVLELGLRDRYLDLLDHGPLEKLALTDISADTTSEAYSHDGTLLHPAVGTRRVVSVKLEGWTTAAYVAPTNETQRIIALQANIYTAADVRAPIAVALPEGTVAAWPATGAPTVVEAIVDFGPERYVLDTAGLADVLGAPNNVIM